MQLKALLVSLFLQGMMQETTLRHLKKEDNTKTDTADAFFHLDKYASHPFVA